MKNIEKNTQTTELKNEELVSTNGGCGVCMDLIEGAVSLIGAGVKWVASLF